MQLRTLSFEKKIASELKGKNAIGLTDSFCVDCLLANKSKNFKSVFIKILFAPNQDNYILQQSVDDVFDVIGFEILQGFVPPETKNHNCLIRLGMKCFCGFSGFLQVSRPATFRYQLRSTVNETSDDKYLVYNNVRKQLNFGKLALTSW